MKILLILAKESRKTEKYQLNLSRGALFHMKTRVSLKYLVTGCRSGYFLCYFLMSSKVEQK